MFLGDGKKQVIGNGIFAGVVLRNTCRLELYVDVLSPLEFGFYAFLPIMTE
jgi:hypothetical protein